MKQAVLSFEKAEILIVHFPLPNFEFTWGGKTKIHFDGIYPEKMIGRLSEISEYQFTQIVDDNGMGCYDNYAGIPDNRYTSTSARESFFSKMKSEGYFTHCQPRPLRYVPFMHAGFYTGRDKEEIEQYHADLKAWKQRNPRKKTIMSRQSLKTFRPFQHETPRSKKQKPVVVNAPPPTFKRPPAVYSNRSHEDTLNYYENLKINKHVPSKLSRRKRN